MILLCKLTMDSRARDLWRLYRFLQLVGTQCSIGSLQSANRHMKLTSIPWPVRLGLGTASPKPKICAACSVLFVEIKYLQTKSNRKTFKCYYLHWFPISRYILSFKLWNACVPTKLSFLFSLKLPAHTPWHLKIVFSHMLGMYLNNPYHNAMFPLKLFVR